MQLHPSFACRALWICLLFAAVFSQLTLTASAQTLTWDADTSTSGLQNGSGTWNTSNTDWLNSSSANTSWVNSTTAIADIGGGTAPTSGTSSAPITITVQSDIQLTTLDFRGFTTAPTSYNMYTLQGDVAGRIIDFGTNGLIQMENNSSGGSQFVGLGSNLRLKGTNLRIQKYGSGTAFQYISLAMSTNPDLTGPFTIGGSIYATITGPGTLQAVDRIVVEAGGSAALSGAGASYTQAFSLAGIGNSLAFSGTAYGALRMVSNNITLSGPITLTADAGIQTNFSGSNGLSTTISGSIGDNSGNYGFSRFTYTRGGDSVVTLTAASTYGGATSLGRNLASYSGGITVLDFSAAGAPTTNILYNNLATPGNLNMASGNSATTLRLVGNAGQTNSQAFKDLSVSGAYNVMELISGTGGTMNLSFGNISRVETTAVLSVLAPLSGTITTTQAAGFAGPWMTYASAYGARSWAQIADGLVLGGYAGDTSFTTGQTLSAAPFTTTSNASITFASTGAATLGATTVNLNTLSNADFTAPRQVQLTAGQTLRLGTQGGIQLLNGAQDLSIGSLGVSSTLSAGGVTTNTAGVLFLTNLSSTGTLTVNSIIANNGTGLVTVVANGAPGTRTTLTGVNTYTGGTQISNGILEIRNAAALGATGTVTVLDGATLALSGGIAVMRALANIEGFGDGGNGAIRSISDTNTITGLITLGAPALISADAGSVLNLGTAPATSILTGSFYLNFGGSGTINVGGAIGAVSGMVKNGLGTLFLSGTNTYTGTLTVNLGTVKLGTATTMATATIATAAGGVVDLNGFSVGGAYTLAGAGSGSGAIISSSGAATLTGTVALTASTLLGGGNDLTINNAGGLTGNVLLTKTGGSTLTVISTATSARSGTNEIDAGTLRLQAALTSIAPVGTGAFALNGGTLSLGMDATTSFTNVVNVIKDSTIIADRASSNAGASIITLSTLTIGSSTLTVKAGSNVTSGTIGLTTGAVSIGGVSMRPGNPSFDAQSSSSAVLTLTLGAISDQAIAPRTLTFQNSGSAASTITVGAAATSLVDGTIVNIASTGAAVTLNVTNATALGSLAQVTVGSGDTLTAGITNIVLGSLAGSGSVNASGTFTLIVGNAASYTPPSTSFSGVLANGTGTLALTKAGLGTLTLNGSTSNSFTGLTTVNAGTLLLGKTGGATAIADLLTIGVAAASTVGNATLRLQGDNQMMIIPANQSNALTINAGGTLDMNGYTLTVNTLASFFGGTITGSGTLILNRTGGTVGFAGANTITPTFQITTANSGAALRTVQVTNVADLLAITGSITQSSGIAGSISKTGTGTLVLSGDNSYTGMTTVSAGILNVRSATGLGSTTGASVVNAGATLQIQGGITIGAEGLTLSNSSGFVGANGLNIQTGGLVNVSGINYYGGLVGISVGASTISSDSGVLNLTNTGTISGSTFGLTLAGAGDGSISSIIGITTGTVTKNGTGTWTLKGVNTSTGALIINAGTLKLGDGTSGKWSSAPGLTYTGGGTFEYGGASTFSTQALGALTLTSGYGTLKVDAPSSGMNAVTFTSLATPTLGSGLNIVSPATTTSVTINGTGNTNGIVDPRITYNGTDFAASTGGLIGAATTTPATSSLGAGNVSPYLISGSFAQTGSVTINAGLKFTGGDTFTINNGVLLTINNGTGTAGGILVTGGVAATIANGVTATGLTTGGSGDLVITTNSTADSLSVQVPITSTTTGGLTKNGLGTLTLTAASTYTGATSINAGTLILGNATAISTSAATVQVGGVLDLSGLTITNTATLNGMGISNAGALINSSATAATIGALTIGTGNGTGGIGASIGGSGSITSTGPLVGNNMLVKTGAGTLTVGNNAGTALASTRTGVTRIDAGTLRISNSTSALGTSAAAIILNGGTLSLGSTASVVAYPVSVTASSTIISDAFTTGTGLTHTLGVLSIGAQTLTVQAGGNITTSSTNAGVTFGATTLLDSPTFDVQSPTTATGGTTTLTLGALSDLGVAKILTFTNTGTSSTNSIVTLGTAMASLIDGTKVNITSGASAGVTLNLNVAAALGTLAQVSLGSGSVLNLGAAQTIGSLTGSGNVTGSFVLTIGNASSGTVYSTTYSGVLGFGGVGTGLTKSGLGTLTLSGANAYTGTTIVSLGTLKLGSATALGATSGVTISPGATLDLNGMNTDRNFTNIGGVGNNGGGAIINSSSTTSSITGNTVLGGAARVGGTGNIVISNAGGLTGSYLLTKFGSGTLTFTSTAASARTGTNQIDEGTLRVQAATVISSLGTGTYAMNGGTLSLGYDASGITGSGSTGNAVNVLASSTIIADRATSGVGGLTFTMGAVIIGGNTLTVLPGSNVTSGTMGLTLGSITIGGPSLSPGNPVFDVQSTASAAMTLTLGALTDQAIAPRTITFQNSGSVASSVVLATAATSLLDGTQISLAGTGGAITLNLNIAGAIGTFSQVTMATGNTLALGASQTISALNGSGTVSATAASVLTVGNPLSPLVPDSTFNGALTGANLSVVKADTGTMTLGGSTDNTLASLAVNSGTVVLAKTGGAAAVQTKLVIGTVGAVSGSATVKQAAASQISTAATVTLNAQGSLDLNGYNATLGAVIGTPGSTILNNATGTSTTLTVGSGNTTGQHLGAIVDNTSGTGTVAFTKTGTGAFVLGGLNTYSGATQVQAGSLQVGSTGMGSTGTGAVTVESGATLLGTGIVQGSSFTAASGSIIQAGDGTAQASYGTLTFSPSSGSGAISFQAGSTIVLGINPGGTSDLLNIVGTGTNTLLFSGNLIVTATAYVPTAPAVFNLIDWSGLSSAPTFDSRYNYTGTLYGNGDEASGLDLPDISGSGYTWDISNFTTNGSIAVVLVPEASRMLLMGLGMTLLLLKRRR